MKVVYILVALPFVANCSAMDRSKIPLTGPWARKRVIIMALLDQNCKASLPYAPQFPEPKTIKKPIHIKAKL